MSKARILVVEDQFLIAEDIARSLKRLGYEVVGVAHSGEDAIRLAADAAPELAIMDIRLKGEMDGVEAAGVLRDRFDVPVVYLTAHSDEATLSRARGTEPLGYLLKPFEERQLYTTIEMALNQLRLQKMRFLEKNPAILGGANVSPAGARDPESPRSKPEFGAIIGEHPSMLKLLEGVDLVSRTDVSVHIYGENGTGKELVADALHRLSDRKSARFVKINCSAIPGTLLESALFGHAKGSFTGAMKEHEGFIEHAEGGTLFLDEIGDISTDIQVKLLRLLQSREYSKVGESKVRTADIRIVTATNRKLKDLVAAGKIREDFYYRVNVFPLVVPALRERQSDIMPIADHFRAVFNKLFGKNVRGFDADARKLLAGYSWPGNVRELENAIKHAFVVVKGDTIEVEHLPADVRESSGACIASSERSAETEADEEIVYDKDEAGEKQVILEALRKTGGNKARASRLLGYSRVTLWKKLKRLGIESSDDQSSEDA